ncbi:MAG: hypothetical protein AAF417_15475 [Pseudomonadota bacterium]
MKRRTLTYSGTHRSRARLTPKLLLLFSCMCTAATATPLFEEEATLEISLTGPLGSTVEDKQERAERRFVLSANGFDHDVNVRIRGNSRVRVCQFPPLRINFERSKTEQTTFAGQDKLKLVTHCRENRSAESHVLREYVAYKIFNQIADIGYRVRLARISYSDTDTEVAPASFDRYAFFIESPRELIARTGARQIEIDGVTLHSLSQDHAARVFVFEYLIGNTDWSLVTADNDEHCCHNGDLFKLDSEHYYVPYDFDLAGLVNTRYAKPDPSLRISRVTQRLYRGYCISSDALRGAMQDIKARKDSILAVVHELSELSAKDRDTTAKYIERFFEQAEDEDKLLRGFERRCL